MSRKYTLEFVSSADLSGAQAAAKAVENVGDAATKSAQKLDGFEADWKARMEALRQKLDDMKAPMAESGKQTGQAAGRGMGAGLELAANMHLVQQAWQIGSMVGDTLAKGLLIAHEGGMEELRNSILAGLGFWSAQVEQELERQRETMPAKYREINAEILREHKEFWADYNDLKPKTAMDWLDDLAKKADTATIKLRGLAEVQAAAFKIGRSQIEQDYLDKRQDIELSSDPESVKARKLATAEKEKLQRELELREKERAERAASLDSGVQSKDAELAAVRQKEAEQQRRAEAWDQANAQAKADIQGRKAGGQQMTSQDERDYREQVFRGVSKNTGINLDQDKDEGKELIALKKRREQLEAETEKVRIDAAAKKQALALESANDTTVTAREQERLFRESEARAIAARRKEMEVEEAEKKKREDYEAANRPAPPPPAPPSPDQVQAPANDLAGLLGRAAQTTGDSGLKMALEEVKRGLADGASAEELKEVAALMQRASMDNSDGMRAVVNAMRGAVDATAARISEMQRQIDALNASSERLKTS